MRPDLVGSDELTREAARRAAKAELSRREYDAARPPLVVRLVGRLLDELGRLLAAGGARVPGGRTGVVLLLLLLAGAVLLLVVRLRPARGAPGRPELFATGGLLSAAEHRGLAIAAAARGEWADAVRERLRAVVRELELRGVLDPRPGRTAVEVARAGGAMVPALAEPLRRGSAVFDEVWYGGRTADATSYAVLVDLDRAVTSTRLVLA